MQIMKRYLRPRQPAPLTPQEERAHVWQRVQRVSERALALSDSVREWDERRDEDGPDAPR